MASKEDVIATIRGDRPRFSLLPAASEADVAAAEQALGRALDPDYRDFLLTVGNGLEFGAFRLLPVPVASNPRKTWDSIVRHNDPAKTLWYGADPETLRRFLVFAVEKSYACYAFTTLNADRCVWYWTLADDTVAELDYTFWDWLADAIVQAESD